MLLLGEPHFPRFHFVDVGFFLILQSSVDCTVQKMAAIYARNRTYPAICQPLIRWRGILLDSDERETPCLVFVVGSQL